ncbi:MAG: hypothetical protein ABJM06_06265 [Gilvibacter sp.]
MAKPDKCISVNEAKDLQANWVSSREPAITSMRNNVQDTREFVFSVAELEEFLEYVKEESDEQDIEKPGIRIYLGAYNTMTNSNATLFMTATKGCESDSDNNYDIEPLNTITGGFPPKVY